MSSDKPHEIVMPQLGLSMDSGIIVRWLKKPGDLVKQGEVLLEVETDNPTTSAERRLAASSKLVRVRVEDS